MSREKMNVEKVYIIVPIYNEETVIGEVLSGVRKAGYRNIIVVDDGSSDKSYAAASSIPEVIVLRHKLNRGKGAAIKTGVLAAQYCGAEVLVTIDGDGQHDPHDIEKMIEPIIKDGFDVVLGTRMRGGTEMPLIKILANKIGNYCTMLLYGMLVSDSQSGFRAYSRFAARTIDTKADKYEYDSKVIREINANRLKYVEVPIAVRYTQYSMTKKHRQGFVNGLRTLVRMVWDKIL